MKNKLKFTPEEIDDLRKSLEDLDFSEEEIKDMIKKAESLSISKSEDEGEDEEAIEEAMKNKKESEDGEGEEEEDYDEEEVKKAYNKIMKMKSKLDKSMNDFLDRFGNVPGFKKPDFDVKNKSINEDIIKSFDSSIEKSFEKQNQINDAILKSLGDLTETVNKIAEAPNPFKSLLGDYSNRIIEKGEKFNDDGKKVISLKNKKEVQDVLIKSLDAVKDDDQKQAIRDEISNYTVTNKLNNKTLDIVRKALNVDFEK